MPAEGVLCIVVPTFKRTCDIRNFYCYGDMKLLGHEMNVVESVLEKTLLNSDC